MRCEHWLHTPNRILRPCLRTPRRKRRSSHRTQKLKIKPIGLNRPLLSRVSSQIRIRKGRLQAPRRYRYFKGTRAQARTSSYLTKSSLTQSGTATPMTQLWCQSQKPPSRRRRLANLQTDQKNRSTQTQLRTQTTRRTRA